MSYHFFFLLFGALILSVSEGSSAKVICKNPCQKGWISYKGRCYKLIQERMTWTKAEETCSIERAGSHLTSITSEEENEFLRRLSQGQKETQLWTGGTYQKKENQGTNLKGEVDKSTTGWWIGSLLKWSDGSLTTFIQRPLSSIFSSVRRLINNLFNIKLCLSLNIGGQGEWDGANCGNKLPFICVYKPNLKHP